MPGYDRRSPLDAAGRGRRNRKPGAILSPGAAAPRLQEPVHGPRAERHPLRFLTAAELSVCRLRWSLPADRRPLARGHALVWTRRTRLGKEPPRRARSRGGAVAIGLHPAGPAFTSQPVVGCGPAA